MQTVILVLVVVVLLIVLVLLRNQRAMESYDRIMERHKGNDEVEDEFKLALRAIRMRHDL